jgi:hypothetical protein
MDILSHLGAATACKLLLLRQKVEYDYCNALFHVLAEAWSGLKIKDKRLALC